MTPLDPDRTLALSYVPATRREAVRALWELDATLGAILASGREPMVSQIRLAWWREALERLDQAPVPAEPVLRALATHVLPAGVAGLGLARIEAGWRVLLTDGPLSADNLDAYAGNRGGCLFAAASKLLNEAAPPRAIAAGEGWALVDLARHSDGAEASAALAAARARLATLAGFRWPRALRPLGMLAALASRDVARGPAAVERQGAPARMVRMMKMRLTGR